MFKSCGSLFDLSRKLGSVVIYLGLAGVLFAGQVSATGGWSESDEEHLANVVEELVDAGKNGAISHWTWDMVATAFNRITNQDRTGDDCRNKWSELAEQDVRYARIYTPPGPVPWTDGDEEELWLM